MNMISYKRTSMIGLPLNIESVDLFFPSGGGLVRVLRFLANIDGSGDFSLSSRETTLEVLSLSVSDSELSAISLVEGISSAMIVTMLHVLCF